MKLHRRVFLVALAASLTVAACASRPRQRPLPTSPVDEGPETMSAVRKQLEGRWELQSLNVSSEDGRQQTIEATGVLTSDAFGGMHVEYRLSDAGMKALAALGITTPSPVISETGQVAIDPQQQRITYVGEDFKAKPFDPKLAAARANPFALERTRHYAFGADGTLTLSTRYDNGKEAAVGRWKKSG